MTEKQQGQVYLQGAINGAAMVDHGDHVTFPCVATAEGVFVSGDGKKVYRPGAVVKDAMPFMNGLRAIINHPEVSDTARMVCTDPNDKDFPTIGWFGNAKPGTKNNTARVVGELSIWKNKNGKDNTKTIEGLRTKALRGDVSIGYYFGSEPQKGEFHGQPYDTVETFINPFHLAILENDHVPCFPQPMVGVGVCWDESGSSEPVEEDGSNNNGGSSMDKKGEADNNGNEPKEQPAPKDLSLEALAGQNAHVQALVNEKKDLQDQVVKLAAELNKAKDEAKAGTEALKTIEKQKVDARNARIEAIKKAIGEEEFNKLYPGESIKEATDAELIRMESIAVQPVTEEAPEGAPAEQAEASETNEAKASPAFKAATKKMTSPSPGANEDDRFLPSLFTPYTKKGAKKDGQ